LKFQDYELGVDGVVKLIDFLRVTNQEKSLEELHLASTGLGSGKHGTEETPLKLLLVGLQEFTPLRLLDVKNNEFTSDDWEQLVTHRVPYLEDLYAKDNDHDKADARTIDRLTAMYPCVLLTTDDPPTWHTAVEANDAAAAANAATGNGGDAVDAVADQLEDAHVEE